MLFAFSTNASHIVGGDIYYDYLGGNSYRFYITLYRDCNSSGAVYDDPLNMAIYNQNGDLVENVSIPFPGSVQLPVIFNNPCVTPPTNICVEKAVYTKIVSLPPIQGGYTISYQRCCRGPNISNLTTPDDTGLTLTTHVPGIETGAYVNSSPRFVNYPPLLLCNNDDLIFNHVATDLDGDQLVYSLVTPFAGASSVAPQPNPAPAPPYFPVTWANTFTATNPLGTGATINIDPNTGLLTASPLNTGLFVVGIKVEEYRNGVLIGQTIRDFLFKVFNCDISMEAILPTQEELATFTSYCQGLTVHFENNSYGGTNYQWDFGVDNLSNDVSSQFEPAYTYPAPGIYEAMLVVNPNWPCTDTAYMTVDINLEFEISFSATDSICFNGNAIDFTGQSSTPLPATYTWNFGSHASQATANSLDVSGISFDTSGYIPISFDGVFGTCTANYIDSILIYPSSIATIILPTNSGCAGLTVTFGNGSQAATDYLWDFGISGTLTDVSSDPTPTYTFPAGGFYTITLIANTDHNCFDTASTLLTVNETLSATFTHNDSLCFTDNNFHFEGQISGPSNTQFEWDFGANASVLTNTTDLIVSNVSFDTNGLFPVSLTVSFDNCTETYTDNVFVFQSPKVDFLINPGKRCAPSLVQFTDLSQADSPIIYSWNFGDGSTSFEQNPLHVYQSVGDYDVSLTIQTTEGCVDTLTMISPIPITITPSPTSNFKVDPPKTDVCHSEITFTNLSIGSDSIYYAYDDGTFNSSSDSLTHTYGSGGWFRPMQIAFNEFGCSDTSYQTLYIEPFNIFIPNTFTPDGDHFNNIFNAVFSLEVLGSELKIYNRWGELVFVSNNPALGWDGVFQNRMAQDGLYTYQLSYQSCEHPLEWKRVYGFVSVLK